MLIIIASKFGKKAEEKGHSRIGYSFLTVLLWFVGEIGLGVVGYRVGGDFLSAVPAGIIGAVIGTVISYLIVSNLQETEAHKALYASRYSGGYATPAVVKKPEIDERSEDEKEEDNFAASVGLSALEESDE